MFIDGENQGLGRFVVKEIGQGVQSLAFAAVFLYHLSRHGGGFLSLDTESVAKETIHVVLLSRARQFHKGIHHIGLYHFKHHFRRETKGL